MVAAEETLGSHRGSAGEVDRGPSRGGEGLRLRSRAGRRGRVGDGPWLGEGEESVRVLESLGRQGSAQRRRVTGLGLTPGGHRGGALEGTRQEGAPRLVFEARSEVGGREGGTTSVWGRDRRRVWQTFGVSTSQREVSFLSVEKLVSKRSNFLFYKQRELFVSVRVR